MSGVYIPRMSMPTRCYNCKIDCGLVSHIDRNIHPFWRSEDCPLVPVPDHGDLIERDKLTGQMERNLWAIEDKAEKELGFDETLRRGMQYGHAVCIDAVNDAPTIIPAEEG